MEIKAILELIKTYGVRGILILCLIWMNNRLNTVEEKMFDCFDDRETILKNRSVENKPKALFLIKPMMVAVLPSKKCNITEIEDEEDIC